MNYTAAAALSFDLARADALDAATLAPRLQQVFPTFDSDRLQRLAARLAVGDLPERLDHILSFRGPSTDGMGGWRS